MWADFTNCIEEFKLIDPPLTGGNFTWIKSYNHVATSRLDRSLLSDEWDDEYKAIKQIVIPRVSSDHVPLLLQCGDWKKSNSYFKFESLWLEVDGFTDMLKEWWNSIHMVRMNVSRKQTSTWDSKTLPSVKK